MASQHNPYGLKNSRERRQKKRRKREVRRAVLATGFVLLEVTGFWLANFAEKDTWTELAGFLLLQPVQIALNLLDGHFKLTRGVNDKDAVLLVTLIALPLNVLLWYAVWRGWRRLRRNARKRWHAARSVRGSWEATHGKSGGPSRRSLHSVTSTASATRPIAAETELPLRK